MGWYGPKPVSPTSSKNSGAVIGALSRKYESNGNPATISNNAGDIGGKSYGSYQIIKSNIPGFMSYLKEAGGGADKVFEGKAAGSSEFDKAWKDYAAKEPEFFERLQHNYIQKTHYAPAVSKIEKSTGLNVADRSAAIQDVLWSTAVQHGSGGAATIFKNAGITNNMTDAEIIIRLYRERSADNGMKYFPSSSDSIRKGVVNRFKSELADALKMIG